jgi:O-antigen/teichoic acid export membrane protein
LDAASRCRQTDMSAQVATVARAAVDGDRDRATFAGTWLLSAAMVVSGVLTYLYHVVAARSLGTGAYGQIAILWGGIFLVAILLFRPLEQTASRAIADRLARGEEVTTVLRSVGLAALGIFAVICLGITLGWRPLTHGLFGGDDFMTAMLLAGALAYGISYLARGLVGGVRWFAGYGLLLTVDSVARLAVAAPLVALASKHTAAVALVVAGLAGSVVPLVFGRRQLAAVFAGGTGEAFHAVAALRFAAPAGVVAGADQLLVNGAPLLVVLRGTGGAKAAGVVFAATMLVRAPVYVFQGMAASLLPNFTLLQAGKQAQFRRVLLRTCAILGACGAVIVCAVTIAGPTAMQVVYGDDFATGRGSLVLLAVGVSLYLAGATFLQVLLALDRGGRAAVAWALAAGVFVSGYFLTSGGELWRISLAFAVAMVANVALQAALLSQRGSLR